MKYASQPQRSSSRPSGVLLLSALLLGGLVPPSAHAADPAFAPAVATPFGLADAGPRSSFCFVDIDSDGDKDVFVGLGDGTTIFQRNTGNSLAPAFAATSSAFGITQAGGSSAACPDLVDIDADGDKDAFVGFFSGHTRFFRNTGNSTSPAFLLATSTVPFGIGGGGIIDSANPDFVDTNGDGDFDLFVGTGLGDTRFHRNSGSSTSPLFTLIGTNTFGITHVGDHYLGYDYAAPCFADLDGDGDYDGMIGASNGSMYFFRNTGNTLTPAFAPMIKDPFGLSVISTFADPELCDIDGDGDLDLFSGTGAVSPVFFQNNEVSGVDDTPPVSIASIVESSTANTSIEVAFNAADSGSGVQNTQLWVKRPADAGFSNTGLTPLTGASGTFNYTAAAGDGVYQFYTIARDNNNNVEAAPGSPDDSITLDTTGPSVVGGIVLLDPSTTDMDAVQFQITFSEPVVPTFGALDVEMIGSLATNAKRFFGDSTTDPVYFASVTMLDVDEDGTIGIRISGSVQDALGNTMTVPLDSPLYTIENYPAGDVSKDGIFNIADVALLGDANLGLTTLP